MKTNIIEKLKYTASLIRQEILGNPKIIILGAVMCGTAVASVVFVNKYAEKRSEIKPIRQSEKTFVSQQTPDDYLSPFSNLPVPEKEVIVIEPEPEPKITLRPEDLFTPLPDPLPNKYEVLRGKILEARRKTQGIFKVSEESTVTDFKPLPKRIIENSFDIDYKDLGLEKNIPSFPVDLTRVLTITNVIPITFESSIRSDIGSQKVQAIINQDVYGTHGNTVLIPRGSKAVGAYEPLEDPGDERLAIVWTRIERPDGIAIVMDAEGLDVQGQAGLSGKLDSRFFDRYGNALLLATLASAAQLTVDAESQAQASAAANFSSEFSAVSAELISQNFDLAPRLTIPSGTRSVISPLTDIFFKDPVLDEITVVPTQVPISTFDLAKSQPQ